LATHRLPPRPVQPRRVRKLPQKLRVCVNLITECSNYFNTISREIMHQLDLIKLVLINHLHGKGVGTTAPGARPVRMSVTHRT